MSGILSDDFFLPNEIYVSMTTVIVAVCWEFYRNILIKLWNLEQHVIKSHITWKKINIQLLID